MTSRLNQRVQWFRCTSLYSYKPHSAGLWSSGVAQDPADRKKTPNQIHNSIYCQSSNTISCLCRLVPQIIPETTRFTWITIPSLEPIWPWAYRPVVLTIILIGLFVWTLLECRVERRRLIVFRVDEWVRGSDTRQVEGWGVLFGDGGTGSFHDMRETKSLECLACDCDRRLVDLKTTKVRLVLTLS